MPTSKRWKKANQTSAGSASPLMRFGLQPYKGLPTGVENRNTQTLPDGDLDRFIETSLKVGL